MDRAQSFTALRGLLLISLVVGLVSGSPDDKCRFTFKDNIVLDVDKSESNGAKIREDTVVDDKFQCAESCCSSDGDWCTLAIFNTRPGDDGINCFLIQCIPDGSSEDVCVTSYKKHSGLVSMQVAHPSPNSSFTSPSTQASSPLTSPSISPPQTQLQSSPPSPSSSASLSSMTSKSSPSVTITQAIVNSTTATSIATSASILNTSHDALSLPAGSTSTTSSQLPLTPLTGGPPNQSQPSNSSSQSPSPSPSSLLTTSPSILTEDPHQLTHPTVKPTKQHKVPATTQTTSTKEPTTQIITATATHKKSLQTHPTILVEPTHQKTTSATTQKKIENATPSPEWITPKEQPANQTLPGNESQPMGTAQSRNSSSEVEQELSNQVGKQTVTRTALLIVTLCFGIIFMLLMMVVVGKRWAEGYKRRKYNKIDYLVNGMYS